MKALCAAALTVATLGGTAAQAATITFNDLTPTIFAGGEEFYSGSGALTSLGDANGLTGVVVDGTDPNRCDNLTCPSASSTYFAALNDGGLNLRDLNGSPLYLQSLDFAFLAPVPMVGQPGGFGQLVLSGTKADGSTLVVRQDFTAANSQGSWDFTAWNLAGSSFATTAFTSVTLSACLFDNGGSCGNPASNLAQFAVDNISYVTAVPEPTTYALLSLGLGVLSLARRRNARAA
ncbi:NF038120 family PEP-CTERM protein [Roseateles sp. BYS180W]|uniref:NF038120 family PEP-CTERM protein n=1 Tax=Roseateles rivi TaxID=3299028 RepID=A0ABW7FX27_9BURK